MSDDQSPGPVANESASEPAAAAVEHIPPQTASSLAAEGPSLDEAVPDFHALRVRSLIGPALWMFGALLWAYVVMGELVVTAELPELLAVVVVLAAVARAWVVIRRGVPERERKPLSMLLPSLGAVLLWFVVLAMTTMVLGTNGRRSQTEAISVALWFLSLIAYIVGRRLTARAPQPRTGWRRAQALGLWFISGAATLAALISALNQM